MDERSQTQYLDGGVLVSAPGSLEWKLGEMLLKRTLLLRSLLAKSLGDSLLCQWSHPLVTSIVWNQTIDG